LSAARGVGPLLWLQRTLILETLLNLSTGLFAGYLLDNQSDFGGQEARSGLKLAGDCELFCSPLGA